MKLPKPNSIFGWIKFVAAAVMKDLAGGKVLENMESVAHDLEFSNEQSRFWIEECTKAKNDFDHAYAIKDADAMRLSHQRHNHALKRLAGSIEDAEEAYKRNL